MGKAHKAPETSYRRRFQISRHAIDRFRERVEEDFLHRNDDDLANLLDARIVASTSSQEITDETAGRLPSTIIQVGCRNGFCYAVIREKTCVTVLDSSMLESNFATGQWKRGAFNPAFSKLSLASAAKVQPKPTTSIDGSQVGVSIDANGKATPIFATLSQPITMQPASDILLHKAVDAAADVAALGVKLAQAMLDFARSQGPVDELQAQIDSLRDEMIVLLERKSAAEAAVKAAQTALNDAIVNATRKP